jgi:hypothetical protein
LYAKKPKLAARIFQEAMKFAVETDFRISLPVVKPWAKLSEAVEMVKDQSRNVQVVIVSQADDRVLATSSV